MSSFQTQTLLRFGSDKIEGNAPEYLIKEVLPRRQDLLNLSNKNLPSVSEEPSSPNIKKSKNQDTPCFERTKKVKTEMSLNHRPMTIGSIFQVNNTEMSNTEEEEAKVQIIEQNFEISSESNNKKVKTNLFKSNSAILMKNEVRDVLASKRKFE